MSYAQKENRNMICSWYTYPIWICLGYRKKGFIKICDMSPWDKQMSTKTVNLLELSDSEKTRIIEKAKIILEQQVSEARLFRSFAQFYT
jgi:hypothetical protein